MGTTYLERETTLEIDARAELPDLAGVVPETTVSEARVDELSAVYYDTVDYLLARLRVTLRHRSGGADAGWHLKVPVGDDRVERRVGPAADQPPEELTALLDGVLAGRTLAPVATIATTRTHCTVVDERGAVVAEVADDRVRAHAAGGAVRTWREVEVELGHAGDDDAREALVSAVAAVGGLPRGTSVKLHRALGLSPQQSPDALSAYVRRQCERILLGEIGLRDNVTAERVHDTRVGIRRLRSTLRVFARLLAPGVRQVDDDLRWVAGLLSEVRDVDVLGHRVREQLEQLPVELVLGPIADELELGLADRRATAVDAWRLARTDERCRTTLRTVGDWLLHPPIAEALTERTLRKRGKKVLRKARRTADKRLRNAGDDPVAVHRARKAAKRLRYTADALVPVLSRANKVGTKAKKVQSRLGHHQDLVVETAFLRDQAARFGGQDGHNGFTYGLLRGRVEAEAAALRRKPGLL